MAVRTFEARDSAALLARCRVFNGCAELRAVLRAGCPAAFGVLALRDLGMIGTSVVAALRGAVTATSPAVQAGWGYGGPEVRKVAGGLPHARSAWLGSPVDFD
jgi:hypothetical protein